MNVAVKRQGSKGLREEKHDGSCIAVVVVVVVMMMMMMMMKVVVITVTMLVVLAFAMITKELVTSQVQVSCSDGSRKDE